jgi:hypothetical protein
MIRRSTIEKIEPVQCQGEAMMLPAQRALAVCVLAVCLGFLYPRYAIAQSATVTNSVLFRTFMVKSDKDGGTIFSIDVDEREYWITAKHILTGANHPPYGTVEAKIVTLSILSQVGERENWIPETFNVIDPGKDVDIVVLAPQKALLDEKIIQSAKVGSANVTFGGECEFAGYPFGSSWTAKFEKDEMVRMPFIKRCTISGQITSPERVWVLDGINNEGFSGGPVVFGTGPSQQIIAVVSGFSREPIEVVPVVPPNAGEAHPREAALANTGFIFAYDLSSALDAIKKNPIGPKRGSKQP